MKKLRHKYLVMPYINIRKLETIKHQFNSLLRSKPSLR